MYQNSLDYVCDYCSRPFTRKYNLQTHIENCHLNSSCYCETCGHKCASPAGMQMHLIRGHNRYGKPFPECDICGRIFTRKQNILSHMISVHLQGIGPVIKCNICDKTFTTERNLKRHKKQLHNPDLNYPTCNECKRVFRSKHSLIVHIQTSHNHNSILKGLIKCELCAKVYTNNRNLKRHVETFHGSGEYKCSICPKVYSSNQSLRRHTKTSHNPDDCVLHPCNDCDTNIYGKDNYDIHVSLYHKNESTSMDNSMLRKYGEVACESCDKSFASEGFLRRHVKTEHSFKTFYEYCRKSLNQKFTKVMKSFVCEYCRDIFPNVYDLKDHMKMNHDKDYSLSTCNVCFNIFYSKEVLKEHKKICIPPADVNECSLCDKLFTDLSSLEFHTRIFHPQSQIPDSNITSTNVEEIDENTSFKCVHCDRTYYSDRSLKHHIKLKHTTDEAVECEYCGKICNNKYYLASHVKIVHNNDTWSKCDYCEKQFKSKRNIRRHIEYTHLGMQRYKCIECETLFKEKRSLRKHVRTKHPNSVMFPQCHICQKRFESAKSCKIHLKLLHSFNMNTFPCDLCPVSFSSNEALSEHFQTKHMAEDLIYKCERCNIVFKGQNKFEQHDEVCHNQFVYKNAKEKVLPRCVICMKNFSTRKTLRRHIKKFHDCFDVDELATYGSNCRVTNVECENCIKNLNDDFYYNVYLKLKHLRDSIIFKCELCKSSYKSLEYFILRYKLTSSDTSKGKLVLSELCTTEMSEDDADSNLDVMEPETTMVDVKAEPPDELVENVKTEPISP